MSEVTVDTEKLAYGLKRGIGWIDDIYAECPFDWRLRLSPCGLVSSAIHQYCRKEDIHSQLLISRPKLDFDVSMRHVIPVVGEPAGEGLVIDAAYSQFLNYAGLSVAYEQASGQPEYPPEEIITFKFSEHDLITHWLTDFAVEFQRRNQHYEDEFGLDLGEGELADASEEIIRATYDAIWDPQNMRPWHPSKRVRQHGVQASLSIPPGTIGIKL